MEALTATEWAVLGATFGEPGDLEQIYERLHAPPRAIRLSDTADAVRSLVEKGLLASAPGEDLPPPQDLSLVWKARFEPTPLAQEVLDGDRPGPPPGWPKGRVYAGMFKGEIPDIPFEVFKENRREMSRKYSEDSGDE